MMTIEKLKECSTKKVTPKVHGWLMWAVVLSIPAILAFLPVTNRKAIEAINELLLTKDPVVIADHHGKVIFANERAADELGSTMNDLFGEQLQGKIPKSWVRFPMDTEHNSSIYILESDE